MANISYVKFRVITLAQNCPPTIAVTPAARGGPAGGAGSPTQMVTPQEKADR